MNTAILYVICGLLCTTISYMSDKSSYWLGLGLMFVLLAIITILQLLRR